MSALQRSLDTIMKKPNMFLLAVQVELDGKLNFPSAIDFNVFFEVEGRKKGELPPLFDKSQNHRKHSISDMNCAAGNAELTDGV